jgi:tetratricopeptide (TPR) repeat protein/predicted Ser/Thr protein kinase
VTEACPFCGREGVEMVGGGDERFCRTCADLIDVPAALKHLPEEPELGSSRLGRYEIVREISRGKAGAVYEARDPSLDRRVALKVLETDRLGGPPLRRFLREGKLLARVRHPNVVQIHELGRDGGKTFIAMEYVDGAPFPGSADRDESIRRLISVARALDHIHRQGIVHRDLKPSNILVERGGRPVVMDFGIARSEDPSATSVTATGAVLGTPGYMAPEQLSGDVREIDARTDIYAMGVLLYEILTGELPIAGATVAEYIERLRRGPPPGPRTVRKDVPRSLDALCRRTLSLRKEDRPASAEEFSRELVSARSSVSIPWRSYAGALGAAAAVAVLAGSLVVWAARSGKEPPAPEAKAPAPKESPVATWIEEAGTRKAAAFGGGLSFEAAMTEVSAAESLYRRAIEADPAGTAALLGLARLYSDLGRAGDAHREFDRVLALDRGNLDALKAKGALVVTAQLEVLLDHKAFPAVSKAVVERLGEQQGRAFDALLTALPPAGPAAALARTFRAIARSEFDEAKRLLARIPSADQPPFLDYALQALIDQGRPSGMGWSRAEEEVPSVRGEPLLWLAIIRHLDRRLTRMRPAAATAPAPKTRVNAGLLRLEAWVLEAREDRTKAAELLGHAATAAPEYLQVRLVRARLLKEAGRREPAARELEAAGRLATSLNLGEAALREIRSLP